MKKAIVFGGCGFLGSFVVQELCRANFQVMVLGHSRAGFDELRVFGFPGQVSFKHFDAATTNFFEDLRLEQYTVAINLVGIMKERGENAFYKMHVDFPAKLSAACKKAGIKFLHVSALLPEASREISKYAKTKMDGETEVRKYNKSTIIVRPALMLGKGGDFIAIFETLAKFPPIIPLPSASKAPLQPVFVCDVARAIVRLISEEKYEGGTFNLAGKDVLTMREILKGVLKQMQKHRILLPLPMFFFSMFFAIKRILPSFVFRTKLGAESLKLAGLGNTAPQNDAPLLLPRVTSFEEILKNTLGQYGNKDA